MSPSKRKTFSSPSTAALPFDSSNDPAAELYAGHFTPLERQALAAQPPLDVLSEIAMLRVCMLRLLALANSSDSLDKSIQVLAALGNATGRLAALIHLQRSDPQGQDAFLNSCLSQALHDVMQELRLHKPLS